MCFQLGIHSYCIYILLDFYYFYPKFLLSIIFLYTRSFHIPNSSLLGFGMGICYLFGRSFFFDSVIFLRDNIIFLLIIIFD